MKVGIAGCSGRVGQILITEVQSEFWRAQGLHLAGGTSRKNAGQGNGFLITDEPDELFRLSDVVIDFTLPEGTRQHAALAQRYAKALIVGTTGLNTADEETLREAARTAPIVYAANMSVGVSLLLSLVQQAAKALDPVWDIEIFEAHHKHKVDAPSGTALALGRAAALGRGVALQDVATLAREGNTGPRESGTIGFSVARGGDVVGEHSVMFLGTGERIELKHTATDRALFARGALRAALWTQGKAPGLYSMRDVLGL